MDFITVRDLRTSPKTTWEKLSRHGKLIVTNNGKPTALMLSVSGENIEDMLGDLRRLEMTRIINNMRLHSVEIGNDKMTLEEINAEIADARNDAKNSN
jgi:hypothetical protein